jgi:uncharacterized protein YraI
MIQFKCKTSKLLCAGLVTALLLPLLFTLAVLAQSTQAGTANRNANLRAGPGTSYAITGYARQGQSLTIIGENEAGDWYALDDGRWIAAFLVDLYPANGATVAPTPGAPANTNANARRAANLRAGPGVTYAVVGAVRAGQPLAITGKNAGGSWLQLADGNWIAAFLVNQALSATPTAAPMPGVTPTQAASGNDFILIEKRLWNPYENGGWLDGPSVHCGQGRQLIVNVLDANGVRLNGVAVQVQYGARETHITGAQGKGDGVAEFVLGGGQDVKVIRDASARTVTSDLATGLSTNPANIPYDILMSAQYCQDEESCKHFAETNSCAGHFSWTVTFQQIVKRDS